MAYGSIAAVSVAGGPAAATFAGAALAAPVSLSVTAFSVVPLSVAVSAFWVSVSTSVHGPVAVVPR